MNEIMVWWFMANWLIEKKKKGMMGYLLDDRQGDLERSRINRRKGLQSMRIVGTWQLEEKIDVSPHLDMDERRCIITAKFILMGRKLKGRNSKNWFDEISRLRSQYASTRTSLQLCLAVLQQIFSFIKLIYSCLEKWICQAINWIFSRSTEI